jgi:hypothetical protein
MSSDGKKENYKEDTLYLWWDQTMKPTMVGETLLGYKYNLVKLGEGCDVARNDVKAAQEAYEKVT